jgi:hypothetical protein
MAKKEGANISIYLRLEELEYLKRKCEKAGSSASAYIRSLINAERFGMDQKELDLDVSKNNLPALHRKIAELENRVNELEGV